MNEEIGLLDLVYQVKNELLTRRPDEEAKGLPALFWIDQIELELSVVATRERSGTIKLSVVPADVQLGGSNAEQRGHKVQVRLTPILTREEMHSLLTSDPRFKESLEKLSGSSLARELQD